jgi:hypothetical protein
MSKSSGAAMVAVVGSSGRDRVGSVGEKRIWSGVCVERKVWARNIVTIQVDIDIVVGVRERI